MAATWSCHSCSGSAIYLATTSAPAQSRKLQLISVLMLQQAVPQDGWMASRLSQEDTQQALAVSLAMEPHHATHAQTCNAHFRLDSADPLIKTGYRR